MHSQVSEKDCKATLPFFDEYGGRVFHFVCSKPHPHDGYHQASGQEPNRRLRYFIEWRDIPEGGIEGEEVRI